jgi:alpha-beta hydrolase superfamily lysophospholipase
MKASDFIHIATDAQALFVRKWLPGGSPKAILLVAHGMAEHSGRYERLAAAMAGAGWAVYVPDLRGHGRTASEGGLGRLSERDGLNRIRDDLREIAQAAQAENPGARLFLFGHSLGSLIAELYIAAYGQELAACVLSGVLAPPTLFLQAAGGLLARLGAAFAGPDAPARRLHRLSFEANNKDFQPVRTSFDWLSRDTAEVDKYVADPLCGFVCSFGHYRSLLSGFASLYRIGSSFAGLPKALPIFIIAGAEDPLGGSMGFVTLLADRFRAGGLQDVQTRLYPGARHELLNETNREEVLADIMLWLESKLPR